MISSYLYTNLFFIIFSVSSAQTLSLLSAKLNCGRNYQISASYILKTAAPILETKYKVTTCKPTLGNDYCRYKTTVWMEQNCKVHQNGFSKYRIICDVKTPYQTHHHSEFKTYGLKIVIMDPYHQKDVIHLSPVTPLIICLSGKIETINRPNRLFIN